MNKKELLNKIVLHLVFTLIIAGVVALLSADIPLMLFIVAFVFEIILLIVIIIKRKKSSVGYLLLYLFAIFSGMTLGYAMDYYIETLGVMVVVMAFFGTAGIFAIMAKLGWDENKQLFSWGKWLLISLLVLIVAIIVNIFIGSAMLTLIIGIAGILIFSGMIMYEINLIMHADYDESDIPSIVVGLYLDFVNLFLSILRVLGVISSND